MRQKKKKRIENEAKKREEDSERKNDKNDGKKVNETEIYVFNVRF